MEEDQNRNTNGAGSDGNQLNNPAYPTPDNQSTNQVGASEGPSIQSTTPAPQPLTPASQPTAPMAQPTAPMPQTPAPVSQPTGLAPQPTTSMTQPATPMAPTPSPEVMDQPSVPVTQHSYDAPQEQIQPANTSSPQAFGTTAYADPTVATQPNIDKPKKSKKPLIIALSVAFLLIIIGAFSAFAIVMNQPDTIALDAGNNLLNAKAISVTGEIKNESKEGQEHFGLKSYAVKINGQHAKNATSSSANLTLTMSDDTVLELDIDEVAMIQDSIYLKLGNLTNLYNKLKEKLYSSLPTGNCDAENEEDCVDGMTSENRSAIDSYLNRYDNLVSEIDGKWWRISIPELLDSDYAKQLLGQENAVRYKDYYNCSTDKMANLDYSELTKLYQAHPAIRLSKTNVSTQEGAVYDVSFSAEELANLYNAVPDTKLYNDVLTCQQIFDSDASAEDYTKVEAESIAKVLESEDFPAITATIDGFLSHHLNALSVSSEGEYYKASADLHFSYPGSSDISAPSDSRSVLELIDSVVRTFSESSETKLQS